MFTSITFLLETITLSKLNVQVLILEIKQQPWHFMLNLTLYKFSFSVQVYF